MILILDTISTFSVILFIFLNSRKAAQLKTKANNHALDIGYPQLAPKSCQHPPDLSLQAP